MQPTVIWKVICALSGILAIRESESNASKIVLEKLMRTSQSYYSRVNVAGGPILLTLDSFTLSLSHQGGRCPTGPGRRG
jgi:hypothetical protein